MNNNELYAECLWWIGLIATIMMIAAIAFLYIDTTPIVYITVTLISTITLGRFFMLFEQRLEEEHTNE